jgi:hypothetical protein
MERKFFSLRRRAPDDDRELTPEETESLTRFEDTMNAIAGEVADEHPDWDSKQIYAETKRRMFGGRTQWDPTEN